MVFSVFKPFFPYSSLSFFLEKFRFARYKTFDNFPAKLHDNSRDMHGYWKLIIHYFCRRLLLQ
jgi:hypothetical protein